MPNNVTIKSALLYSQETEHDFSRCLAEMGKDRDLPTLSVIFDMKKPKPSDSVQENREFKETHLQITFDDEKINAEIAALALEKAIKYKIIVLALITNQEGLIVNSATDLTNLETIQDVYLGKGDMLIIDARPKTVCMGQ